MLTDFKERLARGETFIGAFVCLPCPESAELLAEIGYDWLILDTEHGPYGPLEAQRALQAVIRRCAAFLNALYVRRQEAMRLGG
jgi:2-keto-3-deoxy-L-rhamnonate aldolase RhmA